MHFITRFSLTLVLVAASICSASASTQEKLKALENASGGKIGLYALNTANQAHVGYRENEPFLLYCTSNTLLVGAILKRSMTDPQFMQTSVLVKPEDLASWAPVTQKYVNQKMSMSALSAAAISYSDNTATQLTTKQLGGTQKVVEFARSIHDHHFTLNPPTEKLRPTSTPYAMTHNLQQLILGDVLGSPQREELLAWMKANTTGDERIRAGVPKGWIVADKTGSGDHGITNDIAVIYPPNAAPIFLSIYYAHPDQDAPRRPDILAQATQIVIDAFSLSNKRETHVPEISPH